MAEKTSRKTLRLKHEHSPLFETLFGVDLRSLALFRVALGLIVLHDFWTFFPDRVAFFSAEGVMPAVHYFGKYKYYWSTSLFSMNDTPAFVTVLMILGMIAT